MNLIHGMLGILACQLAGEAIVQLAGIPVPGPVIGLVLLFAFLLWYGEPPPALRRVSDTLLDYLALLFVPTGVGLMVHFPLIARDWLAIGVALVISTAVTLAATMLALRAMLALRSRRDG
ncbi:CidA/LrgA family protein [Aquisalimonas lutea]|uniref:CidA/LrgA family protein n=1 Tax=Aquisalimonas lutea TaxID=1327750 RepID=UPI0025B28997|nr:CidA/LrgA family protein [Aquisalimonas lutea]MDN3517007.1 CidA/LrgA family protein [Aquisalimonas lutea]